MEAKLSETKWGDLPTSIDPHHLTQAKQQLLDAGLIDATSGETKGGRRIEVWHPSDLRKRLTAFEKTAARKRALHSRFLGWSSGGNKTAGVVGPMAEKVTHKSLEAAAGKAKFVLVRPEGGEVRHLLGQKVSGGPLDSAVVHLQVDEVGNALEAYIPIEVKSVRDWIYPNRAGLYQLLDKAARLQQANPEADIVPLLICRRHQFATWALAKAIGFMVIEMRSQFLPARVDIEARHVDEVKNELGYSDLFVLEEPVELENVVSDLIYKMRFVRTSAELWKWAASNLGSHFKQLREELPMFERQEIVNDMWRIIRSAGL